MTDRHFHSLKISNIIPRTELASSIELSVPEELAELFTFKAGQYLTFKILLQGEELRRSYSINSTSDGSESLQVTVKKVPEGKVSNHFVDNLKTGDVLDVMPPLGSFVLSDKQTPMTYFYAAGSGITPIFGLIKTLLKTHDEAKVNLQYGNYTREQVIFFEQFTTLQEAYPARFQLRHHYTNAEAVNSDKGFIGKLFTKKKTAQDLGFDAGDFTVDKLIALSKTQENFTNSNHYICGPGQMIPELEKALLDLGVPKNNIYHEYFAAAVDVDNDSVTEPGAQTSDVSDKPVGDAKLTVILDGDTDTFDLAAGETVLRASIEEGLSVPYACESGVCSTCKAKCISGEVRMRSNSVLSDDEIADGYILACQSEAISAELIVDFDQA